MKVYSVSDDYDGEIAVREAKVVKEMAKQLVIDYGKDGGRAFGYRTRLPKSDEGRDYHLTPQAALEFFMGECNKKIERLRKEAGTHESNWGKAMKLRQELGGTE